MLAGKSEHLDKKFSQVVVEAVKICICMDGHK